MGNNHGPVLTERRIQPGGMRLCNTGAENEHKNKRQRRKCAEKRPGGQRMIPFMVCVTNNPTEETM